MNRPSVFPGTKTPLGVIQRVMNLERPDIAPVIAADLLHLQSLYEKADETYRRFRTIVMGCPGEMTADRLPSEWIPISDQ
jgi:hypothetical protein